MFHPLKKYHWLKWIAFTFAMLSSWQAFAEMECALRACGGSGCTSAGPTSSAGAACALTSVYGSAVFDAYGPNDSIYYSCSNAPITTAKVTCTEACEAPKTFDVTLGQCIDPEKPECGSTTPYPISLTSGYKILPEVDYRFSGATSFQIARDYLFDREEGKWSFEYQQYVRADALNAAKTITYIGVYRENGIQYYFHADIVASSTQVATADTKYTPFNLAITYDASSEPSYYVITMPDGAKEKYNDVGKLIEITTREGLVKTITYTSTTSMTLADAISGMSLKYNFTTVTSGKPKKITSIELKQGTTVLQTYTYLYDTSTLLLTKVTYPDTSYVEYFYGENGAPATALTSKKENGTVYITWDYDSNARANMSTLGDNGAEALDIDYTVNGTTGFIESAEITNAADQVRTLYFKDVGGINKLVHVDGDAAGSCAPSDSYTTYNENSASSSYRQNETITEGVDLTTSKEGVVTRYKHDDTNWPHLVTTKITGLKWSSSAVKPWSTSGTFDPNATDIQLESQKVETSYLDNRQLPIQKKYFGPNSSNSDWEPDPYRTEDFTYDDSDGTYGSHDCTGGGTDDHIATYRVCTVIVTDEVNSVPRTWAYSYTLSTTTGKEKLAVTQAINGPLSGSGDTTTYNYNSSGQLTSVVNAASQTTAYANYNAFGLPETITDHNGVVTKIAYDARGRVETVTADYATSGHINAGTSFTYWPNGLLKRVTSPDDSYLEYTYNSAHQLISVKNNHNEHIEFTPSVLDGKWEIAKTYSTSGTSNQVAQYERVFDALGRLSKIKNASGTAKQVFGYDENDNLTTQVLKGDGEDTVTTYDKNDIAMEMSYDALNRLITATNPYTCNDNDCVDSYNNADETPTSPAPAETVYAYDNMGNIKTVTDANSHTTTYSYNGFGELTEQVSPDSGTTSYEYDAAGRLSQKTDANSIATNYKYDAIGRLTNKYFGSDPGTDPQPQDITYNYDEGNGTVDHGAGIGRLTSVADSSGLTHYEYDNLGRVLSKTLTPAGTALALTTEYEYNDAGALTKVTYPGGRVVDYNRSNDRLSSMDIVYNGSTNNGNSSVINTIAYRAFAGIGSFARNTEQSNHFFTEKEYNNDGLLSAINYSTDINSDEINLGYSYDAFDNINAITNSNTPAANQYFEYDAQQRLKQTIGAYGKYIYDYDDVGNRSSASLYHLTDINDPDSYSKEFDEAYTYTSGTNRLNAILRTDASSNTLRDRTFKYDAAGNRTGDRKRIYDPTKSPPLQSDKAIVPSYGNANRMDLIDVVNCVSSPTDAACL